MSAHDSGATRSDAHPSAGSTSTLIQFTALWGESVSDAFRRRIIAVVCVVGFLMLAMANSCTSCQGNVTIQSQGVEGMDGLAGVLGYAGFGAFALLSGWVVVLAGMLASDQLTQPIEDGSAVLILARPVDRRVFALARLAGSLTVSLGVGLIVLVGTAVLMVTRSELAPGPAVSATLLTLLNGVTWAALAMIASFYLPRVGVFLCVLVGASFIGILQAWAMTNSVLSGVYWVIAEFAPPIVSAVRFSLMPWWSEVAATDVVLFTWFKAMTWMLCSVGALMVVFERRELSA
jgi:ABC-type transport system involved in multi-copper enzyme maturation permease subunit